MYRFIGNAYKELACNRVKHRGPEGTNYAKPRSTPCDVPSDFLAMLGNDLEYKKYLRHMKSCLEEEEKHQSSKENFRVWWFDLNQFNRHRSKQGLVVKPLHPCPVGNDGELFLYVRAGESWRPILRTTGDSLMADRPLDP